MVHHFFFMLKYIAFVLVTFGQLRIFKLIEILGKINTFIIFFGIFIFKQFVEVEIYIQVITLLLFLFHLDMVESSMFSTIRENLT